MRVGEDGGVRNEEGGWGREEGGMRREGGGVRVGEESILYIYCT